MTSTHDLQKMALAMYWFSHVYENLNDFSDSYLFAKNRGDMGDYLKKIVDP
jgi:hypothetical protein